MCARVRRVATRRIGRTIEFAAYLKDRSLGRSLNHASLQQILPSTDGEDTSSLHTHQSETDGVPAWDCIATGYTMAKSPKMSVFACCYLGKSGLTMAFRCKGQCLRHLWKAADSSGFVNPSARCLSVVTNTRRMRPWSYSCRTFAVASNHLGQLPPVHRTAEGTN